MVEDLALNKTGAGLIGSAFFWSYAIGQLINGNIGDRVNSKIFIFIGLIAAAFINITVGFSSSLIVIVILWLFNGFFLSILWGPIVKTLSCWFPVEKSNKIAVGISTSMIGGYLFTWGFVGKIIGYTSWRWAFWIPAVIVLIYSFFWIFQMKSHPRMVGFESPNDNLKKTEEKKEENKDKEISSLKKIIIESKLWLVAFGCIAQGVIKDGITLWGPTFLKEVHGITQNTLSYFSLIIPLLSLGGILTAGFINKKMASKEKKSIIFLMTGAAVIFIILFFTYKTSLYINAILLGLGSALMFGSNTLLLTIIPLNYARQNRVSGVAGFLDFCSYMGAALAGILAGFIVDKLGWGVVIVLWIILSIVGIITMFISLGQDKKVTMSSEI